MREIDLDAADQLQCSKSYGTKERARKAITKMVEAWDPKARFILAARSDHRWVPIVVCTQFPHPFASNGVLVTGVR